MDLSLTLTRALIPILNITLRPLLIRILRLIIIIITTSLSSSPYHHHQQQYHGGWQVLASNLPQEKFCYG